MFHGVFCGCVNFGDIIEAGVICDVFCVLLEFADIMDIAIGIEVVTCTFRLAAVSVSAALVDRCLILKQLPGHLP